MGHPYFRFYACLWWHTSAFHCVSSSRFLISTLLHVQNSNFYYFNINLPLFLVKMFVSHFNCYFYNLTKSLVLSFCSMSKCGNNKCFLMFQQDLLWIIDSQIFISSPAEFFLCTTSTTYMLQYADYRWWHSFGPTL